MDATKLPGFRRTFAADPGLQFRFDADETAMNLSMVLGIEIPSALVDFWSEVGGGYFGNRTLYIFGDRSQPRDSVLDWNTKDYWTRLFPPPRAGGPVFFAETCFGLQIGFRWERDTAVGCILDVDSLTMYRIDGRFGDLFEREFADRQALCDPDLLEAVSGRLGPLQEGMHYAPVVTPLVGGRLTANNYRFETPDAHLRTAIATWDSLQQLRQMNAAG